MILKPMEIVGVTVVGLVLSLVGTKAKLGPLAIGTLLYALGVVIGVKRPSSGWFGARR